MSTSTRLTVSLQKARGDNHNLGGWEFRVFRCTIGAEREVRVFVIRTLISIDVFQLVGKDLRRKLHHSNSILQRDEGQLVHLV